MFTDKVTHIHTHTHTHTDTHTDRQTDKSDHNTPSHFMWRGKKVKSAFSLEPRKFVNFNKKNTKDNV